MAAVSRLSRPRQIASGVYWLPTGRGLLAANVYMVQSGEAWVLVDAAWPGCAPLVAKAAAAVFGPQTPPAAILLTHIHPDHSGSARELAQRWDCALYVHPNELPFAAPNLTTVERFANPLDRWVIAPILRLLPRRRRDALFAASRISDLVRPLESCTRLPHLPDWVCVPTPGHTPGHVAFFRERDRVLLTGDALLTLNTNSLWDFVLKKQRVAGPPHIATWNWHAARASVAALAALEPRVLAGGHGIPMTGAGTATAVRAFARRFSGLPGQDFVPER